MRKIKSLSHHFAMALFFFTLTPANVFFVPSHSDGKIKKVLLKKNARSNGYKITLQAGDIYLEAVKVVDPETKKLVEGLHRLLYRCSQNGPELPVPLLLIGEIRPGSGLAVLFYSSPKYFYWMNPVNKQHLYQINNCYEKVFFISMSYSAAEFIFSETFSTNKQSSEHPLHF